jgi:hypothetical protein
LISEHQTPINEEWYLPLNLIKGLLTPDNFLYMFTYTIILNLHRNLVRYYYSHFTVEKTEVQRSYETHLFKCTQGGKVRAGVEN